MPGAALLESLLRADAVVVWLVVLGVPGLVLGWWLLRRGPRSTEAYGRPELAMPMLVTAAAAYVLAQPWVYSELESENLALFYVLLAVQRLGFAALALVVCARLFPEDNPLRLRAPRAARNTLWAFALYAALLPFVLLLGQLRGEDVVQSSARDLQLAGDLELKAALFLAVVAAAPIFEEVVFRGLVQGGLRRVLPAEAAVLIASLLFMSVHPRELWPQVLCLGAVLGIVQERTRSLAAPVVVHVVHNAWTYVSFLQTAPEGSS